MIVRALVDPHFGEIVTIAGALAFGVGFVFPVVGLALLIVIRAAFHARANGFRSVLQ